MKIGVLGGGQLARMLVLAGLPLGLEFRIYSNRRDESTMALGDVHFGSYDDTAALAQFAQGLDVVTFEFENLSTTGISSLREKVPFAPSLHALAVGQDRAQEKGLFQSLGIPTTDYSIACNHTELIATVSARAKPLVVKTTRLGYDGKGQVVLRTDTPLERLRELGSGPFLVEN